jgi:hypothetical protein
MSLIFRLGCGPVCRIDDYSNRGDLRHYFMQQFEALGGHLGIEQPEASDVAARMTEARYQAKCDRVGADQKDDWNSLCRRFEGKCSRCAASNYDDSHAQLH